MSKVLERLGEIGLIPVVKIEDAQLAPELGEALLKGGLPCAEITFRTEEAEGAIRLLATSLPEIITGAGTVLTKDQAKRAVGAGAQFIVAPGFNHHVVDWCLKHDVPVTPGVATPTEIEMAFSRDLTILKFFPAEALGGITMLKAIGAPYGSVKFIPTGGINAGNLGEYLKLPMVHACGGSWMVKTNLITARDFARITALANEAVAIVQQHRGTGGTS